MINLNQLKINIFNKVFYFFRHIKNIKFQKNNIYPFNHFKFNFIKFSLYCQISNLFDSYFLNFLFLQNCFYL